QSRMAARLMARFWFPAKIRLPRRLIRGARGRETRWKCRRRDNFTSRKRDAPPRDEIPRGRGVAPTIDVKAELLRRHGRYAARFIAALDMDLDVGRVGSLASGGTR